MPGVHRLLTLQKLDLQRDAHVAQMARLDATLADTPEIAARRAAVDAAGRSLAEIDRQLRQRSSERDLQHEHLAVEERKLFSGSVRAAKEVQNLEREVAALRRQLGAVDDTVLELMLRQEEAREAYEIARTELDAAEARASAENDANACKRAALADAIAAIDAARARHLPGVPVADRELYERLRKAKGGRAVAQVEDGICGVCGMLLPRQDAIRVSAGERLLCPGCGRIMVD